MISYWGFIESTRGGRGHRLGHGPTVTALVGAVPVLVVVLEIAAHGSRSVVDDLGGTLLATAMLGACLLFHVHWLLTRWPSSGWLVLGAASVGAYLGVTNVARLLAVGVVERSWLLDTLGFAVLLLGLTLVGGREMRVEWRLPPVVVGVAGGSAVAGAVIAIRALLPPMPPPEVGVRVLVGAGILVIGVVLSRLVNRQLGTPRTPRRRIVGAVFLTCAAQAVGLAWPARHLFVGVLDALAAALVLMAGQALVTRSIWDHHRALDTLRSSVEEADHGARGRRSALHEVRATVSGLSQASQLMEQPGVPPERLAELQVLVGAELARLQRLVEPAGSVAPRSVDLDQCLETVVLRHRLHGQRVLWQPSGHRVWADADGITMIVGTLLQNSRLHAPGATCLVEVVSESPSNVRIQVSDTGRGIPADARRGLFEWAVRGPGSTGEGIGLAAARALARENGGDLVHVDGAGRGAAFAVLLPAAERALRLSLTGVHGAGDPG